MATGRPIYPFSALVGQERLKRALILNAINPRVGGVLIRGEKGIVDIENDECDGTTLKACVLGHFVPVTCARSGFSRCESVTVDDRPTAFCK